MKEGYRVDLPVFKGPLDLLLNLIERQELEITRVSLAQVADQYLAYLTRVEKAQPDLLASFLVIAAKLVLIKSQALLPRPTPSAPKGEADVGDELAQQLQLYQQFKTAAGYLVKRQQQGLRTYVRLATPPRVEAQPELSQVTVKDLLAAVQAALELPPPAPPVSQVVPPAQITIRSQIKVLQQQLKEHGRLVFQGVLAAAATRLEIAVTFLAVLELLKRHQITVQQERLFGKIVIEATPLLDK